MNSNFLNKSKLNQEGFTVLEIVISMAILVFISYAIYQATTETYKLRDTLSTEGNFYNSIRLSTTVMQKDISLIYSPVATVTQKKPDPNAPTTPQEMQVYMADDLGQISNFWAKALDGTGIRPSRFVGSDDKLSFISLSHVRIYRDSPESEFAKITYELKRDEKNTDNPGTLVLVKTESPNAFSMDDYKDSASRSYEILHGVKKLSYSYHQRDGNTWKKFTSWDSDKEETRNQVPDYIEMKLEVLGPKKQVFEGKFKFRPEIPINGVNPST